MLHLDGLTLASTTLIVVIAAAALSFSRRYLAGEPMQRRWEQGVVLLILPALLFIWSDHFLTLFLGWLALGQQLATMLTFDRHCAESVGVRRQARRLFGISTLCLGAALLLIGLSSGAWQVSHLSHLELEAPVLRTVGLLILLAAMIQSALYPFHRWLTSSLLAPTPFSALLHAGIVSAGGILLLRFRWLLAFDPILQVSVLSAGAASILCAGLWGRVHADYKRALLCSTTAQMGYMFVQTGLGLYAAALSHLLLHGVYKAYQFLNSGSAAERVMPKPPRRQEPAGFHQLFAVFNACLCSGLFLLASDKSLLDASALILGIVVWASYQFSLSSARESSVGTRIVVTVSTLLVTLLYAACLRTIGYWMPSQPAPLDWTHLVLAALAVLAWRLFHDPRILAIPRLFVWALNSAQPCAALPHSNREVHP